MEEGVCLILWVEGISRSDVYPALASLRSRNREHGAHRRTERIAAATTTMDANPHKASEGKLF